MSSGVITKYYCLKCKTIMNPNELYQTGRIRCNACGYRTLIKRRPDIVRKIKAV